ncbi:hypothetical protein [Tengunoibacter tsumagoiensis]|uniref:Uncharacterized protein n=1 Tax=Tengunoibacter tsumagoiensis TaxID=2014871 RepID=A0A402A0A4_9CHLR|nr:hypothetical protein [Tengunoibacter tsumagoiensis]GCE12486.1 hypothetical protein KTT_23450 [Tengunoibacter tsumagoiensis]
MDEQERQALKIEVLELGEQLFALALERGDVAEQGEEAGVEKPAREEIAAASDEFFGALRLLLGLEQA